MFLNSLLHYIGNLNGIKKAAKMQMFPKEIFGRKYWKAYPRKYEMSSVYGGNHYH